MNISKIAVKRPITTLMGILIILSFGTLSILNLNMDMMPNMDIPYALVSTSYSGTGPSEMKTLITEPLESALGTVPGVKSMESITSYGSSIVAIEFETGTNIDIAALDMRERVDMVKGMLPDGASDPMVMKVDINAMTSLDIGISSDTLDLVALKTLVDDNIVDRLRRQDGVASVNISGGREKEISVTIKEERLRGFGITESQIMGLLRAENLTTPTGTIMQGDRNLQLRVTGEFTSLEDIRNLPINTPRGAVIFLRDVADVEEVFKDVASFSYMNGQPSITISIQKQSTANVVNVSTAVIRELDRVQMDYPHLTIDVFTDPADMIRSTLGAVTSSALMGVSLLIVVLYLFLRNVRSTIIVAVAMPVSIFATFILMFYSGITLNVMSLGGLALGVGLLIDNSIVVLESIYRKMEQGENRVSAAMNGAREVSLAITASTLTTIAVFLPISFFGGLVAQIFNQLSLTIAFSLLASLVVSLTFVPMASSLILSVTDSDHAPRRKTNFFGRFLDLIGVVLEKVDFAYKIAIEKALTRRKTVFFISILFVLTTFMLLPRINMEFMPATDENGATISISMPLGTVLEETEIVVNQVLSRLHVFEEITNINHRIGSGGGFFGGTSSDSGSITLNFVPKTERSRSSQELAVDISDALSDIAGADITVRAAAGAMGGGMGDSNVVQLSLRGDDLDILTDISEELIDIISQIDGTREVESSVSQGSPQATITIDRVKAANYGIAASNVSSIISTAVNGVVATTFKVDGDEFDVRLRQNNDNFDYISDIQNILIPTGTGINVPLYEIASISIQDMPVSITRLNQEDYMTISAVVDPSFAIGTISAAIQTSLNSYQMPSGYSWAFAGATEQMNETFFGLAISLITAIFLIYMIMAAQFESLMYPLIVMFSVPIALTCGIFGIFVMGDSLSITSFLGLIMLSGIVLNNAIVLIDYTNLLIREQGYDVSDALATAGQVRLRPILMTTLTTVIGLIPIMLSTGEGSELMRGLAVVVVFGLALSTFVTLLLIPAIYLMFTNFKTRVANRVFSKARRQ